VHSGVSSTSKGALSLFRRAYETLPAKTKEKVTAVYVVQPSFYLTQRMKAFKRCFLRKDPIFKRLRIYER